jgi:hypothetical protein
VRYRVRAGSDGIPNLERQENVDPFQILARGIEDLQVQYVRSDAAATVSDNAPAVAFNDYTTLITQVRVSLSARAIQTRIQGATVSAAAGTALRGSLQSQASPRQALWTLTQESPAPVTPRWN